MTDTGTYILNLLDTIPIEIRINHILPNLHPETLVWLNKELYIKHHDVLGRFITIKRCERFPLGKWESYMRYMVRNDCSFVLCQLLRDNAKTWLKKSSYYYKGKVFMTYMHFLFHYSIDTTASRCRKQINDVAIEIIGKKWYKRTRVKSDRWSN